MPQNAGVTKEHRDLAWVLLKVASSKSVHALDAIAHILADWQVEVECRARAPLLATGAEREADARCAYRGMGGMP